MVRNWHNPVSKINGCFTQAGLSYLLAHEPVRVAAPAK